jgi:hypothetical protein
VPTPASSAVSAQADLFETICQIRGDELVHHFRDEVTPDEQALGSFTCRKLKQLSGTWDIWLASERKQLDAHQNQSVFGVPCPALLRLAPLCCVLIGLTTLSPMGLAKLACAAMDLGVPLLIFASLKRTHASASRTTPTPTVRRLPKRHTLGLTMLTRLVSLSPRKGS